MSEEKEVKKKEVKQEESLRDKILKSKDIEEDIVEVKEWGVKVKVTSLNVEERGMVRASGGTKLNPDGTVSDFDPNKLEIAALIAGAKDPETDLPIFTEADMDLFQKKNARAVDAVALRILELSGMTPEAGELKKKRFRRG